MEAGHRGNPGQPVQCHVGEVKDHARGCVTSHYLATEEEIALVPVTNKITAILMHAQVRATPFKLTLIPME